jgi:hypothetical protein
MSQKKSPPRLYAVLARESSQAILIGRRGEKTFTINWDRATDTFAAGQLLTSHRIERSSIDIAPDGRHWLYNAYSYARFQFWLVLARTPEVEPLWTAPSAIRNGNAGLFLGNETIWTAEAIDFPSGFVLAVTAPFDPRTEHVGIFRACRDGWHKGRIPLVLSDDTIRTNMRLAQSDNEFIRSIPSCTHLDYLYRPLPGGWTIDRLDRRGALVRIDGQRHFRESTEALKPKDPRRAIHEPLLLTHPESGREVGQPTWEWADWDSIRQRLVWTEAGVLRTAELNVDGLGPPTNLFDGVSVISPDGRISW